MDDRKIRSLLTVLETGSISSAAERLNGTQSGITQAMNALEAELGFKVLSRTNRGVTLTESGAKILPTLRLLDENFRKLEREAREISEGKGITIRIGTYSSVANTWLPDILSKYAVTHPDTAFDILVGSDKLPRWLQQGKVDMLLVDEAVGREFKWFPVMEDVFKAAVPVTSVIAQRTSVTEEDLLQYPVIVGTLNTYRRLQQGDPGECGRRHHDHPDGGERSRGLRHGGTEPGQRSGKCKDHPAGPAGEADPRRSAPAGAPPGCQALYGVSGKK